MKEFEIYEKHQVAMLTRNCEQEEILEYTASKNFGETCTSLELAILIRNIYTFWGWQGLWMRYWMSNRRYFSVTDLVFIFIGESKSFRSAKVTIRQIVRLFTPNHKSCKRGSAIFTVRPTPQNNSTQTGRAHSMSLFFSWSLNFKPK